MDELYDDLENYDDVDTVNQLKSTNSNLQHLLDERNKTIENLQKDFDKLAADFKVLQNNYSSLLKIARAEVQRKTDMITKLNIEKDTLIITAAQKVPHNEIQKLLNNVKTNVKCKKKKKGKGPKDRTEFIRRKSKRPPSSEGSSTVTDNSNKMVGNERVMDNTKTSIRVDQENEVHRHEVFPDQRGDGSRSPVAVDRRVSALTRHQFSKLSSDEEFEDLYSALKPETSFREPERSLREPERSLREPERSLREPERSLRETKRSLREPERSLSEPERSLREPERSLREPERSLREPERSLREPERSLREPERSLRDPERFLREPERSLREPERSLREPERSLREPERSLREPERSLREPERSLREPERSLREPERSLRDPERSLREPERSLREPERSLREPERSLREPERSLREPERNRKRGRDKSEDSKTFYNNAHDRPSNYPDPLTERFNRNRPGRFSNNDRNMDRDKKFNESDKHVNRDKQYDSNKIDKHDSNYQRDSPERHRRGAKELSDDRYTQYDRNRKQLRSRDRRRSCHDRERDDPKQDALRYNQPETHTVRHHFHGEYDEPQNKRPRIESRIDPPYLVPRKDRRLSEKQDSNEMYLTNLREHTCQSPDFSHEESSNEHITEIRSTASTALEDPRVTSNKYVKSSEGHKEVLQSVNANKIHLQPVNKSLWSLEEVPVPNALTLRPSEISDELVDEMDIDKPSSIISMESGEIGSETTDTVIEDVCDFQEGNQSNYKYGSCKRYSQKIEKKHRKEKSPILDIPEVIQYKGDKLEKLPKEKYPIDKENSYQSDLEKSFIDNIFKDIGHKSDLLEKEPITRSKLVKSEKANNRKSKKPTTVPPRDNKVATNTHSNTTQTPSVLHRLLISIDKSPGRDNSDNSWRSEEEKEHKETSESKNSGKTEQETSRTKEQKEHKKSSEPEKENESSVQIVREFEHRVYSTRHIVEGDLELSDESNDETQLKIDEKKIDTKVKQKIRRKSTRDICEEKPVDLEETTRKTRSKKDKGKDKTPNKFSELFGDSSSLITPEDLNLATRVAHALPAECCPPAPEDAQDGIIASQQSFQTLTSKVLDRISEAKGNSDGSMIEEDKTKAKVTKNSRNRTHKRHKKSESVLVSDDTHKSPAEQELSESKKKNVNSTETPSVTEVKLVLPNEKLKQMQNAKITTDTNKNDALKPNEKPKGSVKSNKRVKNKDEKKLSISDPAEESNTMKTSDTLEANSNKILASDNKENASGNDKSKENISSIIENTLVSDVSKVNTAKQPLHHTAKDTISSTVVENVPNLAPVIDEPGLVKTVVISTGIQLLDSNSTQCSFNALASSTPVRGLSTVNSSSDMEPIISHSAHVSVTIERDDTVSQPENDAPDIRINYYRRRRKVLKE